MTRTSNAEEQRIVKETIEKVATIADKSSTEPAFLGRVNKEIPGIKIYPLEQSVSGGITFSIIIYFSSFGREKARKRIATIKKKFPN